jgi:hypothetical protein
MRRTPTGREKILIAIECFIKKTMHPVSAVQVDVSIGGSSFEMNRDASSGVYGYRIGSRYGLPKENF